MQEKGFEAVTTNIHSAKNKILPIALSSNTNMEKCEL